MAGKVETQTDIPKNGNLIGLEKSDYRGRESTLCQGCGHNSISSQIIAACYEMSIQPEKVIKMSGIGCSSKSPAYFLSRSFGFNALRFEGLYLFEQHFNGFDTLRQVGDL